MDDVTRPPLTDKCIIIIAHWVVGGRPHTRVLHVEKHIENAIQRGSVFHCSWGKKSTRIWFSLKGVISSVWPVGAQ